MSDYIIAPSKHDPIGKNEIIYAYLVIVPPCTLTSGDNVYEQPSEMYIKIGKVGRGGVNEERPDPGVPPLSHRKGNLLGHVHRINPETKIIPLFEIKVYQDKTLRKNQQGKHIERTILIFTEDFKIKTSACPAHMPDWWKAEYGKPKDCDMGCVTELRSLDILRPDGRLLDLIKTEFISEFPRADVNDFITPKIRKMAVDYAMKNPRMGLNKQYESFNSNYDKFCEQKERWFKLFNKAKAA